MSLSYSKIIAVSPMYVREVKDIQHLEEALPVPPETELFVESTEVKEDKEGNLWIYSPRYKRYYELYRKNKNEVLLEIYPTIAAEVTADCKAGLALYPRPSIQEKEITRKEIGEVYSITSIFHVDDRENIWVKSIEVIDGPTGYSVKEGWIIYKNRRNRFTNLYIRGKYNVVTTNGELDDEKVETLRDYLKELRFNWVYQYTAEPLQLFAKKTRKTVNTGQTSSNKKGYTQAKAFNGDPSIKGIDGKRKDYPFKNRTINAKTISSRGKAVVQNSKSFPRHLGKSNGVHQYDYYMDYSKDGLLADMDQIRRNMNADVQDYVTLFERLTTQYNRFKLATASDALTKGFPHVFFTRPDCRFFSDTSGQKLAKKPGKDMNVRYMYGHRPALIRQLTQVDGDEWLYLLSNRVGSFQTSDESIETDTYGANYHKQKIAFGKSNHESKAAGNFTVQMTDTRDMDILNIHKLWTEYISNVYHGKWHPKWRYLWEKVIDYASSCYYIITAEDGETILFWSKYYGVFPTNIPSSSYSWNIGSPIGKTDLSITYQYSCKEDLNPQALVEFNLNSKVEDITGLKYEAIYNPNLGTTGRTWVGKPFVETCYSQGSSDYQFKLRFMKGGD